MRNNISFKYDVSKDVLYLQFFGACTSITIILLSSLLIPFILGIIKKKVSKVVFVACLVYNIFVGTVHILFGHIGLAAFVTKPY